MLYLFISMNFPRIACTSKSSMYPNYLDFKEKFPFHSDTQYTCLETPFQTQHKFSYIQSTFPLPALFYCKHVDTRLPLLFLFRPHNIVGSRIFKVLLTAIHRFIGNYHHYIFIYVVWIQEKSIRMHKIYFKKRRDIHVCISFAYFTQETKCCAIRGRGGRPTTLTHISRIEFMEHAYSYWMPHTEVNI